MTTKVQKPASDVCAHDVDLDYFIEHTVESIGGKHGSVLELFQNSKVAGATAVSVFVQGRCETLEVLDNGRGMGHVGRMGFTDLAKSPYRGVRGVRSQHGYGRLRALNSFEHFKVTEISDEDPEFMYALEGTRTALIAKWTNPSLARMQWRPVRKDPASIGLLPGATGVRIALWGSRGKDRFTAAHLIKNLAEYMTPWDAETVRVHDGKSLRRLEVREIVGDDVLKWVEQHPVLGNIHARIYFPKHLSSHDRLIVGTEEPICEWRDVARQIPEELWDETLAVLGIPMVCGHLYFSNLMEFRSGTTMSFESRLFNGQEGQDILRAMIGYLAIHIVRRVNERLGAIQTTEESERDRRLLEDIAPELEALGGVRKRDETEKKTPLIELFPRRLQLAYGDSDEVEIVRVDPDLDPDKIEWDPGNFEGKIQLVSRRAEDRLKRLFTAGRKAGSYMAYVRYPRPKVEEPVSIEVFDELTVRIKPANPTIPPGQRKRFRLVNWEGNVSAGENCKWVIDPSDVDAYFVVPTLRGKELLEKRAYGETVEYQAGSLENEVGYALTVLDTGSKKEKLLASTSVIIERKKERPPAYEKEGVLCEIDDIKYRVRIMKMKESDLMSWASPTRGGMSDITLNTASAGFVRCRQNRLAYKEVALEQVLLQHLAVREADRDLPAGRLVEMVSDLYKKVALRLGESGES